MNLAATEPDSGFGRSLDALRTGKSAVTRCNALQRPEFSKVKP